MDGLVRRLRSTYGDARVSCFADGSWGWPQYSEVAITSAGTIGRAIGLAAVLGLLNAMHTVSVGGSARGFACSSELAISHWPSRQVQDRQ